MSFVVKLKENPLQNSIELWVKSYKKVRKIRFFHDPISPCNFSWLQRKPSAFLNDPGQKYNNEILQIQTCENSAASITKRSRDLVDSPYKRNGNEH